MTKSISRQFAMVAEGNHRGAGDLKNKNVPDGTGNITLSSSVAFLYRNKEKMLKDTFFSLQKGGIVNISKSRYVRWRDLYGDEKFKDGKLENPIDGFYSPVFPKAHI